MILIEEYSPDNNKFGGITVLLLSFSISKPNAKLTNKIVFIFWRTWISLTRQQQCWLEDLNTKEWFLVDREAEEGQDKDKTKLNFEWLVCLMRISVDLAVSHWSVGFISSITEWEASPVWLNCRENAHKNLQLELVGFWK